MKSKLYFALIGTIIGLGALTVWSAATDTQFSGLRTAAINLGAAPSVLKVSQGGTGASSFTAGECLKGNGTGAITTGACGAGGLSGGTAGMLSAWTSSSALTATSGPTAEYFYATGTRASVFPYASTTAISGTNLNFTNSTTTSLSATVASTSLFWGAQLRTCNGGSVLTWSAGQFGCATDQTGGTSAYDAFTHGSTFGTTTAATTSSIWTQGAFFASSSIAASQFNLASTTQLTPGVIYIGGSVTNPAIRPTGSKFGFYSNGGTGFDFADSSGNLVFEFTGGGIINYQEFLGAIASGDPTNPAYTFSGDGNTGMYRIGADILGFTTAGIERLRIAATGNLTYSYASSTGQSFSSSLSIPTGSAPGAGTAGDLAFDTSDNQLLIGDSGNSPAVIARRDTELYKFDLSSTSPRFASGAYQPLPLMLDGYTVTHISCYVTSGTSKIITVSDGSNDMDSITCATTKTDDDGSIANATITAGTLMRVKMGATTGAVDSVSVTIVGKITRE